MQGVAGAVAIVTGAGQGNGKAIALGLAAAGADVGICDINAETTEATAAAASELGARAYPARVDVADAAACQQFAADVADRLGKASILVNNAGVIRRQKIDEKGFIDGWDTLYRVNVEGTRNMVRAFLPQLRATAGRIVNLGSIMSVTAGSGLSAYASSKGAVLQFTRALAAELAPDGVRVNAIAPGVIATPMTETTRADTDAIGRFLSHTPMGRVGEPDELVGPVLFLASSMSSYVTGALLPVDGGYLTS